MISAQSSPDEIRRQVQELGTWFHNFNLGGVQTAPNHFLGDYPQIKWRTFAHAIPQDLSGKSVLDIGCNAGFYSIEMKRRGAARVVGIDSDETYLAQARFAARMCEAEIEFCNMSTYEVGKLGEKFDLVLLLGVFYHLRHPLLALDLIHEHVAKDLFVFQSMQRGGNEVEVLDKNYPFRETAIFEKPGFPKMYFIEKEYAGDPTNWWVPNRACAEALLRSAGFQVIDHPESEVFVCRRRALPDGSLAVYPARERVPQELCRE